MSFRSEIPDTWNAVLNKIDYIPFVYTNTSIDFQLAYQRFHGGDWQDISVVIYWDSKAVAVWPLTLSVKHNQTLISSQGMPVQSPLYVDFCPSSSRKRISKSCLNIIDNLAKELNVAAWDSSESFNQSLGFSEWHILAMSRGSICSIHHDLFLNLQWSMDQIKHNFRKSYKSLITSGMKNWSIEVLDTASESIWDQFKTLHLEVSGKKTRSDETWDIHFNSIKNQQGFLVYLLNNSGKMDGGGFFNFTRDEGLYAVGAYNRALFDKPLGHVVQYRAIQELKKRGVIWYKLGSRPYFSEKPEATDKEISIADFKQGFSSHIFPRFNLSHRCSGS
jgi:FemAB family protein